MENEMIFDLTVRTGTDKKQSRSALCAAVVCLRDRICPEAGIFWPAIILHGEERIAEAEWSAQDGALQLRFHVDGTYASDDLPSILESALLEKLCDFPENNADIIQEYANSCTTIMKYVDTVYRGMPVYGFAFAVDKYGGLMIMTQASRTVITVYSGHADLAVDEPQQPDYPVMPRV